jgi:CRISPR system Cascade subunit CasE
VILTRITINPHNLTAAKDLNNPYSMHQTIKRITENTPPNAPTKVLWRTDHNPNTHQTNLTIQTHTPPDTTQLPPNYFTNHQTRTTNQLIINNTQPNTTVAFRVRANPNVTKKGIRTGITNPTDQIDWLTKRLTENGVTPHDIRITESITVRFKKPKTNTVITLATATYEGIITIDDPHTFRTLMNKGIGRALAFGYGLITLTTLHKMPLSDAVTNTSR